MVEVCSKIQGAFAFCGQKARDGGKYCRNFWWPPKENFNKLAKKAELTRAQHLATTITFVAFVVAEIAGFVLLAVANKTPAPFHPLIGLYVCVGALALCPIALCIIHNKHPSAPTPSQDSDSDSEEGD